MAKLCLTWKCVWKWFVSPCSAMTKKVPFIDIHRRLAKVCKDQIVRQWVIISAVEISMWMKKKVASAVAVFTKTAFSCSSQAKMNSHLSEPCSKWSFLDETLLYSTGMLHSLCLLLIRQKLMNEPVLSEPRSC